MHLICKDNYSPLLRFYFCEALTSSKTEIKNKKYLPQLIRKLNKKCKTKIEENDNDKHPLKKINMLTLNKVHPTLQF